MRVKPNHFFFVVSYRCSINRLTEFTEVQNSGATDAPHPPHSPHQPHIRGAPTCPAQVRLRPGSDLTRRRPGSDHAAAPRWPSDGLADLALARYEVVAVVDEAVEQAGHLVVSSEW